MVMNVINKKRKNNNYNMTKSINNSYEQILQIQYYILYIVYMYIYYND